MLKSHNVCQIVPGSPRARAVCATQCLALRRRRGRAIPGAAVEKSELRGILSATGSWKASIFEKHFGRPIEVENQELFMKIQGEANK